MNAIAHRLRFSARPRRAGRRVARAWTTWSRSLWDGLAARQPMSDRALLSRTTGAWPSVAALLAHLAARPGSSWLLPHDAPAEAARLFREHYPRRAAVTVDLADAIVAGRIRLLGHDLNFGVAVDWHGRTITGWAWPVIHRLRLSGQVWSDHTPADPILTWELNRHQHLATLGIAYWLTGDPRYVATAAAHLAGWLRANPVRHGINWLYPLEVAVRLLAWTLAFQFFRQDDAFVRRIGGDFLKGLYQQAEFVSQHLQTTRSAVPNNHLVAEATALAVVGACFPELGAAAAWRETGLRLLEQQAIAQVHPDGVHKEQAIGYHRFVAELFLCVVLLGRRGILPRSRVLEDTLERMLDYVCHTQTPSGGAPYWGDSDYGRALGIQHDGSFWDSRHLLAMGAVLFDRPDWKWVAGSFSEEAFWQAGQADLARWQALESCPPRQTERAFPAAGIYVLRSGWTEESDVAFMRCGPFGLGPAGPCSHAHCDLLSPLLWLGGRVLLVDSGTFTYHGAWRDPFRLTPAHNTLMVDAREQATPRPHFGWTNLPQARCETWDVNRVAGTLPVAPGVWHRREVVRRQAGCWEVVDHLSGSGAHSLRWYFHLAPHLSVLPTEVSLDLLVAHGDKPFARIQPPPGVLVRVERAWSSLEYGQKLLGPLLQGAWQGEIPAGGLRFAWRFDDVEKVREQPR